MNFSELCNFLSSTMSVKDFIKKIDNEVSIYKKNYQKLGSSLPVILNSETCETYFLKIDKNMIIKLCELFLSKTITEWHIYYIVDAIFLNQEKIFSSEKHKNLMEYMTDPEVNGELTEFRARWIINKLQNHNNK